MLVPFFKNMENIVNCLKNDKLDNASRKMQFLQPAQLSFVLSFFCHLVENL